MLFEALWRIYFILSIYTVESIIHSFFINNETIVHATILNV